MRILVVLPVPETDEGVDGVVDALRSTVASAEVRYATAGDGFAKSARAGFHAAVAGGDDVVITMDADGSHDPGVISTMLGRILEGADVVIGSRYVGGGGVGDRQWWSRTASRLGNLAIGAVLGLGTKDCTSRFRAYRSSALTAVGAPPAGAVGAGFSVVVLRRLRRAGHRVVEVPVVDRGARHRPPGNR